MACRLHACTTGTGMCIDFTFFKLFFRFLFLSSTRYSILLILLVLAIITKSLTWLVMSAR
jgi:hypothetical protein